ncbi:MAG: MATE family efflux transporter [Pseudomonadota bacterium]
MRNKGLDLGKGPIFPLLLKMSWPSIIAMLAVALANLIDAFWLAKLSTQALAALTTCFPLQMIFAAIGIGTGVGAGSYAARMFGAGQSIKAKQTAGQVIFLSAVLGILTIIPVLLAHDAILRLFGAHHDILPLARQYLLTIVWGTPFFYLLIMAGNLLRAEGRPNLSMSVVLTFCVVLIILEPFLVFGWGPFPKLGIAGAGFAAAISYVASSILSIIFLRLRTSHYEMRWLYLVPRFSICRSIYQTGFPTVIMNLVVSLVMISYIHILTGFGPLALATFGLCFRLYGLISMVLFGIGYGVMPLVAFNEGAGLYERLIQIVRVAARFSALLAGVSSLLLILFAGPILMAFTGDAELVTATAPALRIFNVALVLVGPIIVWINMFIGLGRGTTAMLLMLFRDGFLLIPLLFILPHGLGIHGVWMAQPISTVLAFFLIFLLSARQIGNFAKIAP